MKSDLEKLKEFQSLNRQGCTCLPVRVVGICLGVSRQAVYKRIKVGNLVAFKEWGITWVIFSSWPPDKF